MSPSINSTIFDATAADWRIYQGTNAGRLRNELLWLGLRPHLPQQACRVLDLGAGTGELAARCRQAGHAVTLVDFSQAMLTEAARHLSGPGVTMICASVDEAPDRLADASFDVVVCHSVLEFVEDPGRVMRTCAGLLADGGVLSVAFGNRHHAPLRSAIVERDLDRGSRETAGTSEALDCFGLPKHLFDPDSMRSLVRSNGLRIVADHGVRVVTDLLDLSLSSDPARYDRLLALEVSMMGVDAYRDIARYVQVVARAD